MHRATFRRLLRDERGAAAVEYALITMLMGVAAITAFVNLGDTVSTHYSEVDSAVGDAINQGSP